MNNVNERIAKINKYKDRVMEEKRIEQMEEMVRREKLYNKIHSLADDICNLYDTAIACDANGIFIHDGRFPYIDYKYKGRKNGEFIKQQQKCSFLGKTHNIKGLCLWHGGGHYALEYSLAVIPCMENLEEPHNHVLLYGFKDEEDHFVSVDNVEELWLKYFVDTFEEFKNDFYNYVDNIVN